MSSSFDKYQKRRLISSYFSVVLSIALVLFLLGVLGLFVLNAKKVSDLFKEKVTVSIYLKDSAKEVETKQLEKSLALADYVKATKYVSKEQAAEIMKAKNGEDFMEFTGYNPLQNSIDVTVKADYVTASKLDSIVSVALEKNFVDDVKYDSDLVTLMNNNVRMAIVLYFINKTFPQLNIMSSPILVTAVFILVFILGIVITWISTHFATQRFLNLKTDQLY